MTNELLLHTSGTHSFINSFINTKNLPVHVLVCIYIYIYDQTRSPPKTSPEWVNSLDYFGGASNSLYRSMWYKADCIFNCCTCCTLSLLSHTHSLTLSYTHTLSLSFSRTHTRTHTHAHTHTQTLYLYMYRCID